MASRSIRVLKNTSGLITRIQGDRVQLQQVLLNLMINAIEAMHDVGEGERELLISSRNEPDGVSVEVRDSGPGFAPAELDRVFEAARLLIPAAFATTLILHNNSVVGSDTRRAPTPMEMVAAATEQCAPAMVKVRLRVMTPTG